jgi:hypothetical protein
LHFSAVGVQFAGVLVDASLPALCIVPPSTAFPRPPVPLVEPALPPFAFEPAVVFELLAPPVPLPPLPPDELDFPPAPDIDCESLVLSVVERTQNPL